MTTFKREPRYVVFKFSDMAHLNLEDQREIFRIAEKLDIVRGRSGKQLLDCVVIEADWPEFEPAWKAIEDRMVRSEQETKP